MTATPISDFACELMDMISPSPERWPVVRVGPREPIPWHVRVAVARRDGFCCRICHRDLWRQPAELDHIVPWSAGGSDDSANLRMLCVPCNQGRSNFRDWSHRGQATPCTWWCVTCWTGEGDAPRRVPAVKDVEPIDLDSAPPVTDATIWAYCAQCGHIVLTDRTI